VKTINVPTPTSVVRLLVNGFDFTPFKNAGQLLVWGETALYTYSGWNVLAGDTTLHQLDMHVNDIVVVEIRCDAPEIALGLGSRVVRVRATHICTTTAWPTVITDATYVLDESVTPGQEINSVGVSIDYGTWNSASNYSLGRLNP
jgi:hypothetical protein